MRQKYINLIDLATRFGVTPRTVKKWLAARDIGLPAPVEIGNRKYFDLQQIVDWEIRNKKESVRAA